MTRRASREAAPPRILIVDDEREVVVSLKRGLESHGLTVETFDDPLEAVKKWKPRYDVAVFDIRMPGMNGFELARKFHEVDPEAGIFFMTAFEISLAEFRTMFPQSKQVAGLLRKPFMVSSLVEQIERFLDRRDAGTAEDRER